MPVSQAPPGSPPKQFPQASCAHAAALTARRPVTSQLSVFPIPPAPPPPPPPLPRPQPMAAAPGPTFPPPAPATPCSSPFHGPRLGCRQGKPVPRAAEPLTTGPPLFLPTPPPRPPPPTPLNEGSFLPSGLNPGPTTYQPGSTLTSPCLSFLLCQWRELLHLPLRLL